MPRASTMTKALHTTGSEAGNVGEPVPLKCQNCGYEWTYKGDNPFYAPCSRCKSSVHIKKQRQDKKEVRKKEE